MVNVLTKYLKTPSKTVEKDDNKPKEINLEESGYELKIMNDKLKFDKKKKRRFTRRKVRKNCRNSRFRPIFISEPCVDLEEIELDWLWLLLLFEQIGVIC